MVIRKKIQLIEGNAKCRHLKKLTWTSRQVSICLRPRTPYLPPYTLYTCILYTVYLFTQGRGGGGVEPERRLERKQVTKLGRIYQHD
jgi:hypothetical protein